MPAKSLILSGALLAIAAGPARAHDIYSHLVDDLGGLCCNDFDCQPVLHRTSAGGVQMLIHGRWIDIAGDKIQYRALPGDLGITGGSHWCGSEVKELGSGFYLTRCAILPPQSASAEALLHEILAVP